MRLFRQFENISVPEKFLAQYDDESVTKPGQIEDLSDDRLAGLQLYGKFYGFYESMTREKDTELETAHVRIIKQLETFAETFVINSCFYPSEKRLSGVRD